MSQKKRRRAKANKQAAIGPSSEVGPALHPDLLAHSRPPPLASSSIVQHTSSLHVGPLPAPSDLKAYEDIYPGLANRIVTMAEEQSAHRRYLEAKVITSDVRRSWGGLIAALVVAVIGLGGSFIVITMGHDWAGATIAGGTLTSLVGAFLYGSWSKKSERLEKAKPSSSGK